ncbi:MAG: phosphonate ABC transporter ATP-binding protein, partial [Bacteriovoracaceae bacterium]|nr:phosphonate ABC transporter ATP-binding protein [Bacteriovoracaceae bacterium]
IARAMAQGPDMILADEPIASLDPKSSDVVMGIIKKINMEKGIPVIVNLHQYEFAKKYATRIVGMNDGRIVYDGPPENLDNETLGEIYKGGEE